MCREKLPVICYRDNPRIEVLKVSSIGRGDRGVTFRYNGIIATSVLRYDRKYGTPYFNAANIKVYWTTLKKVSQ